MLSAPNPPFWALVHTPNFSHNPLEIDVIHFLQPFRALPSLTYLSCENCVLFGAITDDALCYVEIEELRKWLRKPSEIPGWVRGVRALTSAARNFPHTAHAAMTRSLQMEWDYVFRVVLTDECALSPLREAIAKELLPALLGGPVTPSEVDLMLLPARHSGTGICDPLDRAAAAYPASRASTKVVSKSVQGKAPFHPGDHRATIRHALTRSKQQQDVAHKTKREAALPHIDRRRHRVLSRSAEYKTSGWLTTLPSTDNNTGLDAAEFRDALNMRYGRHPPGLAARCDHCNQPLTVDHALCCKRYGLVIRRHDELRDTFAELIGMAWGDAGVRREVVLKEGEEGEGGVRADIVARGVWERQAAASFDICITDPDATSYASKNRSTKSILKQHETAKKKKYRSAVCDSRVTFCPLVVTCDGVWGHDANVFIAHMAHALLEKEGWKGRGFSHAVVVRKRYAPGKVQPHADHFITKRPAKRTFRDRQGSDIFALTGVGFTEEEDAMILRMLPELAKRGVDRCNDVLHKEGVWTQLAGHFPHRTVAAVRRRALLLLASEEPNIKSGRWAPDEERKLLRLMRRLGRDLKVLSEKLHRKQESVRKKVRQMQRSEQRQRDEETTKCEDVEEWSTDTSTSANESGSTGTATGTATDKLTDKDDDGLLSIIQEETGLQLPLPNLTWKEIAPSVRSQMGKKVTDSRLRAFYSGLFVRRACKTLRISRDAVNDLLFRVLLRYVKRVFAITPGAAHSGWINEIDTAAATYFWPQLEVRRFFKTRFDSQRIQILLDRDTSPVKQVKRLHKALSCKKLKEEDAATIDKIVQLYSKPADSTGGTSSSSTAASGIEAAERAPGKATKKRRRGGEEISMRPSDSPFASLAEPEGECVSGMDDATNSTPPPQKKKRKRGKRPTE
ncbi:unnamed protein product [Vitrella brassicaformis CCMP3155]|uniref:Myb-like domain-containing protein n=1 Tax=Vitrella brassicaformis (strain CCMP3155) TaxID=1169540 RepID=A0A0G4GJA0_VITBC|nr:unnamed protein product [Vitrella brassicaformis CCMP3155]|eukprot:CEM29896.1 unnamed protein product [Vitrella brassicaformis CCMP3155]